MKNDELVSIIIPAYNVEKYIEKCVMSCIEQDYSNIEVIAVDDGSPDLSGEILDSIAKKYNCLKVFHKKNGGVSRARNYGMNHASGDYICFVDGDDFLEKDFVSYMMKIVKQTSSDFVLSKNCFTFDGQIQPLDNIKQISAEEATALLLSSRVEVGCWNKMYKRKMLIDNEIFFNETLFFGEGLEFIIRVAQISNNVGIGERLIYNYRKNNLSSATTNFNYKNFINGEKSLLKIQKDFVMTSSLVNDTWKLHYFLFCSNALIGVITNRKQVDNYKMIKREWKEKTRKYSIELFFKKITNLKIKVKIIIVNFMPIILVYTNNFKRKKKIKGSVS